MFNKKSPTYLCSVCRKEFKFEDIRYGSDGKTVLCKECYDKNLKSQKKKEETSKAGIESDKVKVICTGCRYKFSLKKKGNVNPVCPYCGKNDLMIDDTTAEKIVEDVKRNSDRYR